LLARDPERRLQSTPQKLGEALGEQKYPCKKNAGHCPAISFEAFQQALKSFSERFGTLLVT
jgi:hypothetical protein